MFFELDKVGGDNGRFRLTPTKVSTAKGIILAIESAERVNPVALLVGHHCVAKEPKIMDLAYNFWCGTLWTRNYRLKWKSQGYSHQHLLSIFRKNRQSERILYYLNFGIAV